MLISTKISIASFIFSVASGLLSLWYTHKQYKEAKRDTCIAEKSNRESNASNDISKRSNRIAEVSINRSIDRDSKKFAVKASHVFYENIQPKISDVNKDIDAFIMNDSVFRFKYGINKQNINPSDRLLAKVYNSPKFLQSIINIIIDINDWVINVNSGMADIHIITEILKPMLYTIYVQGIFASLKMDKINRNNYDKLMKSFHFKL